MPAFKFQQNNSLIVLGRGHKARGYELALGFSPNQTTTQKGDCQVDKRRTRSNAEIVPKI
jgi:hypothetical protein